VEVDRGNERLAKQIRNAEQQKVPLIVVVGEKEMESNTLAVRSRKFGDLGSLQVEDLLKEIRRCSEEAEELNLIGEKENQSQ
jgi:threonyl-tRNA synthetase